MDRTGVSMLEGDIGRMTALTVDMEHCVGVKLDRYD